MAHPPRLLPALLLLLLAACSVGQGGHTPPLPTPDALAAGAPQPAQPAAPPVIAAETFLADIARHVAGDRLPVESLLPPGVDPHEFQPAPQDAIRIAQARILIVNGAGYETWLAKTLPTSDANASGAPLLITAAQGLPTAPGSDPHLWMDPANAIRYTENIRDGLTLADPAGKDAYAANAAAYIAQLRQLDASIRALVAQVPPERRLLVSDHDDLGHFARAYGFTVVGAVIPSITDEVSPSAQQMAALIDAIRRQRAPAIFLDAGANRVLADQVASGSGAQVVTGLYVESLSPPDGPAPTYIGKLTHDAQLIVDALK